MSKTEFDFEELFETCLDPEASGLSEFAHFHEKFPSLSERYTDEKQIAVGGMKTVFKVFDQYLGRHLAMAKLNEDNEEENYMPFIREARLTANLEHPNIIKVHEIGFYDLKKPYFTMELKTGDSFKDILDSLRKGDAGYRERYNLRSLLMIFLKVCDALSYSHSRKVIHLDIKPENIQVGEYGEVMVCDWGLAKVTGMPEEYEDEKSALNPDLLNNLTIHSEIKGTPGYMAPEQITRKGGKDYQTDVYSLGALLYSILTYRVPVEGSIEDILGKTVAGDIISVCERAPELNIPEGMGAIVSKAMATAKEDRYNSALELISEINKYLDGYSPAAEQASLSKEAVLFYRRNKKVCITTFLFLIILAGGSAYFIRSLKASRDGALVLKDNALQEKIKAEMNLKKYKEEKGYLDQILTSDPTQLIVLLKHKLFTESHKNPEATMNELAKAFERISETNRSHVPLYEIKGELHFIRQEFMSSLAAMKKGRGRDDPSNTILFEALEAVQKFKVDKGPAPLEVIFAALDVLKRNYRFLSVNLMYYDSMIRSDFEEHLQLVKKILQIENPEWDPSGFEYLKENKSLKLIGDCSGLSVVWDPEYGRKSLIQTLNVEYLDLREVKKISYSKLMGINVDRLDVRGHRINAAFDKSTAKTLIVDKELVHPEVLPVILKDFNIVFSK